jgi:Holliday junction DNA helicase RuvA
VIALLRGEVAARESDHAVILAGDVGYRVAASAQTLREVPPPGGRVTLHTHLIAREDALTLYGFHSREERELFLMLLSVQAVGPKVALAVLSGGAPPELLAAIAAGDAARFQSVQGIGKRTADRIIVELREKVSEDVAAQSARARIVARRGGGGASVEPSAAELARAGLIELGYAPAEADALLCEAEGESAEELIAGALRGTRTGA